jgi:hypothetical protein
VALDVALEASAPAALDDVVMPALLALIWKRSPSPATAAFLTHCRRAFAVTT